MKKRAVLALVMAMSLALAACGKADDAENSADVPQTEVTDDTETTDETDTTESADETEVVEVENSEEDQDETTATDGTAGELLLQDFQARITEDAAITPQDMADALLTNEMIKFAGMTLEVEAGYLTGFSNEISGFEQGVMFSPMIGSIPFVGYIFTVADGEDVDAFVETLKTNADPRWNICTEAEETVVEASGNTVFFVMCPKSLEG